MVANYFGGSVAVLPVLEDGRLGDATDVKADEGNVGPTKATNAPPCRYRPATGRGTSTSIRTAGGSTRSRRRARPSCSSTMTPSRGG